MDIFIRQIETTEIGIGQPYFQLKSLGSKIKDNPYRVGVHTSPFHGHAGSQQRQIISWQSTAKVMKAELLSLSSQTNVGMTPSRLFARKSAYPLRYNKKGYMFGWGISMSRECEWMAIGVYNKKKYLMIVTLALINSDKGNLLISTSWERLDGMDPVNLLFCSSSTLERTGKKT